MRLAERAKPRPTVVDGVQRAHYAPRDPFCNLGTAIQVLFVAHLHALRVTARVTPRLQLAAPSTSKNTEPHVGKRRHLRASPNLRNYAVHFSGPCSNSPR